MADKYPGWSPYNYCLNNPLRLIDPDGMAPTSWEEYLESIAKCFQVEAGISVGFSVDIEVPKLISMNAEATAFEMTASLDATLDANLNVAIGEVGVGVTTSKFSASGDFAVVKGDLKNGKLEGFSSSYETGQSFDKKTKMNGKTSIKNGGRGKNKKGSNLKVGGSFGIVKVKAKFDVGSFVESSWNYFFGGDDEKQKDKSNEKKK